jgi:DNA invertase Pin-like site-specific DNA recombinase
MPTPNTTRTAARALLIVRQAAPKPSQDAGPAAAARTAGLRAHLERLGYTSCEHTVVDGSGAAGWGTEHPLLRDALQRLRAGEFEVVALASPDRLGRRDPDAWPALCAAAAAGGASVVLANAPGVLTPDAHAVLFGAMLTAVTRDNYRSRRAWARARRLAAPSTTDPRAPNGAA